MLMEYIQLSWGTDNIKVFDVRARESLQRAAEPFDDRSIPELPFELTPGLLAASPNSNAPFSNTCPLPGRHCETTHRLLYELTGLDFPAAIRVKSKTGVFESLLAMRASLEPSDSPDSQEPYRVAFEGYHISDSGKLGHRFVVRAGPDIVEISSREIDNTWKRVRPRVMSRWNVPVREVTWPLSDAEAFVARKPRVYKKAELSYDSVAPALLDSAIGYLYERGAASSKELQTILGVPEKQAVGFWKGLIADKIFELMPNRLWVLNEKSQLRIEKKKPAPLTRKDVSVLINQLVKNAEAINQRAAGTSALYVTGLEALGSYLDIKQDEFDYLYVIWHAELRRTDKWPYIPDLLNAKTGFQAVKAMLHTGDSRLRLLEDIEAKDLSCHNARFFKYTAPEDQTVAAYALSREPSRQAA